jgi:hypothetical protein
METCSSIKHAHRDDGKRFVVHADELLTAFLELEAAIRTGFGAHEVCDLIAAVLT